MIGVPSSLYSGRGPRLSVLNRQATSSLLKLAALIWSSGEYLLPLRSAVYIGHSPFFVLGCAVVPAWPASLGAMETNAPARITNAGTVRKTVRDMVSLLKGDPRVAPTESSVGDALEGVPRPFEGGHFTPLHVSGKDGRAGRPFTGEARGFAETVGWPRRRSRNFLGRRRAASRPS